MPIKVALVHDWLHTHRGGERVLEALCEIFPSAPIYSLFYSPGRCSPSIEKHKIHCSFLNRLPGNRQYYRYLLPLFPLAIESLDLLDYDLVLSSSHCVAKGILPSPGAIHITYCHTPMRYAWDRSQDYFGQSFARWLTLPFLHQLRQWDVTSSARVDHFIANSEWVKKRILKYYRREATVIPPFVDLNFFSPTNEKRDTYYLTVSSLVPYKRVDRAIEACRRLGKRLIVVGDGPQLKRLKASAGPRTEFLGHVDSKELRILYSQAQALLFPGEEDFGIAPLEAMACGTPIIALSRGGLTETVQDNETGLFFNEPTVAALEEAILNFEKVNHPWADACRARAEEFSRPHFIERMRAFLQGLLGTQLP